MAKIDIEIADLESILTNFRQDHTEAEIRDMEEDLARYNHIKKLWQKFGDIPMDPETECLESEFVPHAIDGTALCRFPPGTHREDIWYWFEEEFGLSVAEDLMYG